MTVTHTQGASRIFGNREVSTCLFCDGLGYVNFTRTLLPEYNKKKPRVICSRRWMFYIALANISVTCFGIIYGTIAPFHLNVTVN